MATSASSEEYVFRKIDDGVYVRKCFGIEITGCKMAELCDGFTHLNVSAAVKIDGVVPTTTRKTLEQKARAAWAALRHMVPGIASRSFKLPSPDESYALRYVVPKSQTDVNAWLDETVIFSDEVESLREAHRQQTNNHWWPPSTNHCNAELHVAPLENGGWRFSLSLIHSAFDGRAAFSLMDAYLKLLTAELRGTAKPISSIEWGTETVRLQAPGSFAPSIAETGEPPEISVEVIENKVEQNGRTEEKPVPAPKPWLYAPSAVDGRGDVSKLITFSRETTSKLHATAKKHGYTITQVFTALYILAHTEAAFRTAGVQGVKRFEDVSGSFEDATRYLIAWTFINQRHKFPGGYDSIESNRGSPLVAQDGTSPLLSMDVIRSMFKLDRTSKSVSRVVDGHAFWDGLVSAVAAAWKAIDQSLEAYLTREKAVHAEAHAFDPALFHIPALIISSIGDLGRLGIMTNYLPNPSRETPEDEEPRVIVEDVVTGLRSRLPVFVNLLYQYDGQLSSHFHTAGEYTSAQALQLETDIFQEWVDALVAGL